MNILLVYPKYPDSFWSYKHALKFISKKAAVPPLGLITVSSMLPAIWQRKLIDLNVTSYKVKDLLWADYVFISAMHIQKDSVSMIIEECQKYKVKIVAGGPLFTQDYQNYPEVDHFVLNEAEITLPLFLNDLMAGHPEKKYSTTEYADMNMSPVPDYKLLNLKAYSNMNLQISRGCPFACDFCEITSLLGHKVRMKDTQQVILELEALYALNWRGPVFIVDDNFIGNKQRIKTNLLPALKSWMKQHKYPFIFNTQVSINIADDAELLELMTESGFDSAFIGIETPDENSLQECNKVQNKNRNMIESVKIIQKAGMQVSGGFIVGFDSDSPSIFQRQIDFIQQSGIVTVMVGMLNAPKNTRLYDRLESENRLTVETTGNNTDSTMNFIPKMDFTELRDGYNKIIKNVYSSKPYYKRIRQFLLNYQPPHFGQKKLGFIYIVALLKSIYLIGIINRNRGEYWKLIIWTLFNRPDLLADAITYTVYGYHYQTVYGLINRREEVIF
jgi:radical SAM superfamily enzyme YgiQ (UPF0313 family)